jgi:uncharacterized membrane-anchored protein YjiN (DUF445 family)
LLKAAVNETLQEIVHKIVYETMEETIHGIVSETVQETVNETSRDTLLDTEVFDALDKMIRDGEPEFLNERILKKLEHMRKDAKTPLYNGPCK